MRYLRIAAILYLSVCVCLSDAVFARGGSEDVRVFV